MTKLSTILPLLLLTIVVNAQPPYLEKQVDLCVNGTPVNFYLENNTIYISQNQHLSHTYGSGPITSTITESNILITKADTFGNINAGYTVLNSYCNEFQPMLSDFVVSDNYMFLTGSVQASNGIIQNYHGQAYDCINTPVSGTTDIMVSRTSPTGTVEWVKCYGGYDYDTPCNIVLSPNNTLIIAGSITIAPNGDYASPIGHAGNRNMWLAEINKETGDIIREKCFGSDTGNTDMFDIVATHDNGYLITGITYCNPDNQGDVILIKVDSLFNMQWRKIIPTPGQEFGSLILEDNITGNIFWLVNSNETDSIFKTSHYNTPTAIVDDFNNWLIKLNSNSDSLWVKNVGTPYHETIIIGNYLPYAKAFMFFNLQHEVVTITNSLNVTYNNFNMPDQWNIHFMRFDTTGTVLTNKILPDFIEIHDIIPMENDRYLCLANMKNSFDCAYQLATLGNNTVGLNENQLEPFIFYPNPASNFVILKLGTINALLQVYTTTGQLVQQENLINGENLINVSGLSNGIYICQIRDKNEVKRSKLIISK